jgi:uracil-DNA glycosylase family 4
VYHVRFLDGIDTLGYGEEMKKLAQKQAKLAAIAAEIAVCPLCRAHAIGLPVPGEGSADADIVFIGEAPGKQEAATGRPFVGRSGKVLRAMIADVGLQEEDVFITSPVKYLPRHVTPTPPDVAHGRTHLLKQFEVIEPKIIVLLGRVACLAVLEQNVSIAKEHGTIINKDGQTYLIAYHPAAVLYYPPARAFLKKDFQKLKRLISS